MLLSDTLRNALANQIDATVGTTGAARFQNTAQTATYATCNFQNPAFGTAPDTAVGEITLAGTPSETNASAGTVTRCGIYNAVTGGTLIMTLGVNSSGTPDMTLSNTTLSAGDQVDITALSITVPAGSVVT
jgi:hypothetical protein